jgi:hypothetical protein
MILLTLFDFGSDLGVGARIMFEYGLRSRDGLAWRRRRSDSSALRRTKGLPRTLEKEGFIHSNGICRDDIHSSRGAGAGTS